MVKKLYMKPEISYVDFSLSSSIAGTCKTKANHYNDATCEYEDTDGFGTILFNSETNDDCSTDYDCYHAPDDSRSIFAS